ncbi:MAG: hypothetical protein CENE_03452 [Candidatus Celerinatantimonas neptuna]|nr:MAG: hypothetical protein CENE_03452 [Candidatus Celerinatantimonas neptuna]
MKLSGGCFCQTIRYQVEADDLIEAGLCHCRMCQQSSGAPVMAWVTFPFSSFRYLQGSPVVYRSSNGFQREHCPICGTQLTFKDVIHPVNIDVTIASLDEPEHIAPDHHIWMQSNIPWFHLADHLPVRVDDEDNI